MGFLSQGIVTGEISMLSEPWVIHGLGECNVFLFKPDITHSSNPEDVKVVEAPEYLAKLALHAPSYVEATELLRSKDEQITQLRRENAKIGGDLSASATFSDGLWTAVEGFRTKEGGEIMPFTPPKRFGMAEFLFLFAPSLIGYYLTVRYLTIDSIYGMLAGLAAGCYLVWRRMG